MSEDAAIRAQRHLRNFAQISDGEILGDADTVKIDHTGLPNARSPWAAAAFAAGCVALLIPVWIVRYPPLLDYPNHLASSFVLAHIHDPSYRFSTMYDARWIPSPYVAAEALLVVLQRFMPVELAGRVVLSICLLALPFAVWFFVQGLRQGSYLPVIWAFVLSYNVFFTFGFIGYDLSLAACFMALGLWLRYLDRPSAFLWTGGLFALVIVYFLHIYGFVVAGTIVTVYGLARRQQVHRLVLSWLLFVPGCLMYLLTQFQAHTTHDIEFATPGSKIGWLVAFLDVHPGQPDGINLLVYAALLLSIAVAVWKNPQLGWDRSWLGVVVVLFALYWLLPMHYGDGWAVDIRILPFLLLIVSATVRLGKRERWLLVLTVIIFGLHLASVTRQFLVSAPRLANLARSFDATPDAVRVLPLFELGSARALAFKPVHFWGYGVITRGWLSPYLFTLPGINTLHARQHEYPPYGLWLRTTAASIDWKLVCEAYDYVWAYNVPYLTPRLRAIGTPVTMMDGLALYRTYRPTSRCQ